MSVDYYPTIRTALTLMNQRRILAEHGFFDSNRKRDFTLFSCRNSPAKTASKLFPSRPLRHNGIIQKNPKNIQMVWKILCVIFGSFVLSSARALAATAAASPVKSFGRKWFRPIMKTLVVYIAVSSLVQQIRVKRRQSKDATSEWGRYASQPAARGRAVMTISMKLLPFWIASKLVWFSKTKQSSIRNLSGKIFADSLLQLGPLYIKIGQILSCRENLLPEEWIKAMEKLQDRVPAKSGEEALQLAHSAMGSVEKFDQIFSHFDTVPLAAASLGQVHKAILRDTNETVAVKIQRPKLREIYDQDFALMMKIAKFADNVVGSTAQVGGIQQSWTDIFSDAEDILYREIDYRDEADNTIRFTNDFGIGKGGEPCRSTAKSRDGETLPSAAPWLRAPIVYGNLSSEQVLVMEYVPSIKITNTAKLDAMNVTDQDKEYLADCLARAYLRQFCANCFFSTDPHPGNLGVEIFENEDDITTKSSSRPPEQHVRLVFYDFGQACSLNYNQSEGILDVIEAIVDMDAPQCVTAFQKMGVLKDDSNISKVEMKVQNNFETGKVKVKRKKLKKRGYKFKNQPKENKVNSNSTNTNGTTTTTTTNITKSDDAEIMSFFTLPAEYAFVARAISQMDGVGKGLDVDFDFISSSAPYLVEVKGAKTYIKDEYFKLVSRVQRKVLDFEVKYGLYRKGPNKKKGTK